MHYINFSRLQGAALSLALLLLCSGCSGKSASASGSEASQDSKSSQSSEKLRPNTPQVLIPDASQSEILGGEPLTIDISHKDQGYVMARYSGDAAKANIQITGSDGINYKYFLASSDTYTPLPLTSGSGSYQIDAYENVVDNKYTPLFKESMEVTLSDELLPYLYPNQYVFFTEEMNAVSTARDTVASAQSDLDAVADIYHYIIEHITYDEEKAASVKPGYLPDIDSTLSSGKGICFDYASLTAAMLRSQGIPTRLEIGYSGEVYHAWISVYIEDKGWIDKIIEFSGDSWTRMDPTFASGNDNNKKILEYIGDGSNYTLQYTR
ncbi:MAG: transglutaminase-like domain-containing protein [Oliverpabstia sp.]|nr:transglutaminase-like domain-containing protein [Oliverpabstia sp.]